MRIRTDAGADRAVIAQEGVRASGFAITFSHASGRWSLVTASADTDAPVLTHVESSQAARIGTWAHLSGGAILGLAGV